MISRDQSQAKILSPQKEVNFLFRKSNAEYGYRKPILEKRIDYLDDTPSLTQRHYLPASRSTNVMRSCKLIDTHAGVLLLDEKVSARVVYFLRIYSARRSCQRKRICHLGGLAIRGFLLNKTLKTFRHFMPAAVLWYRPRRLTPLKDRRESLESPCNFRPSQKHSLHDLNLSRICTIYLLVSTMHRNLRSLIYGYA